VLEAYKNFWKKYVDFEGRTTRSDWWWVTLCNSIIVIILFMPILFSYIRILLSTNINYTPTYEIGLFILLTLFFMSIFIPSVAMNVRRLRDAGYHWALIFIGMAPYVGSLVLFILLQMPSKISLNNSEIGRSK
jgi:Predicted membrane protein